MISVLLPQSEKKNQKKKPQLFKHFSNPQIINRLVNIMLGTNIIISHEYFFLFFFAVMCTKQRLSAAAASATCFHCVSGFFFSTSLLPHCSSSTLLRGKSTRGQRVCVLISTDCDELHWDDHWQLWTKKGVELLGCN